MKWSCQLAQISTYSEPLVHPGREPRSTCVGWMPKRPGALRSEAKSPLGCVHALLKKKELKQVYVSSTSSCEYLFRPGRWVQHGANLFRNSFDAAPPSNFRLCLLWLCGQAGRRVGKSQLSAYRTKISLSWQRGARKTNTWHDFSLAKRA